MWQRLPVGARVVVRATLPEGAPKRFTDVIGVVVAVEFWGLRVRRDAYGYDDDGGVINIASETIVAAKEIPSRPAAVTARRI